MPRVLEANSCPPLRSGGARGIGVKINFLYPDFSKNRDFLLSSPAFGVVCSVQVPLIEAYPYFGPKYCNAKNPESHVEERPLTDRGGRFRLRARLNGFRVCCLIVCALIALLAVGIPRGKKLLSYSGVSLPGSQRVFWLISSFLLSALASTVERRDLEGF